MYSTLPVLAVPYIVSLTFFTMYYLFILFFFITTYCLFFSHLLPYILFRLACNWFPAPGGDVPVWTWPAWGYPGQVPSQFAFLLLLPC